MAEDVAQDANDDFVTVKADSPVLPAESTDSVVDPEAPPAEPVPVHDPYVKIPEDEAFEDAPPPAPVGVSPIGPDGTFRGHAAVEAERIAAAEAAKALRVDPVA